VVRTRHIQAQIRSTTPHRGRSECQELAARERRDRGEQCFKLTVVVADITLSCQTVLGSLFLLPESPQKSIYYIALITELCKLLPSTVGPAVGKSIRKLYTALGDGLDPEVSRRFVEWFAVHMSNFGFQWVWKEWCALFIEWSLYIDDARPCQPGFRTLLSWNSIQNAPLCAEQSSSKCGCRIMTAFLKRFPSPCRLTRMLSLPNHQALASSMKIPVSLLDLPQLPSPHWRSTANPYYDATQSILGLLRGRSRAEEVISQTDSLRTSLESTPSAPHPFASIDSLIRSIGVQSLLSIGSRSFSHLLNAIERYLPLLRGLANPSPAQGGGDITEAKTDILNAVFTFWKRNRQIIGIVFDKLMQYQIVDPTDVIAWTFGNSAGSSEDGTLSVGTFEWDLIKGALDKANGRVMVARRKVAALRKEQDDSIARVKASGGADVASMEVDGEVQPIKQGMVPRWLQRMLFTSIF